MEELIVILGALITILASVVVMNVHRRRSDILTGGYIFADNEPQGIFTERTLTYFTEKIRYLRLEARSPAFGPGNRPPSQAV